MFCNLFKSSHKWEYFDREKTAARCIKCGRSWIYHCDTTNIHAYGHIYKIVNVGENKPCNRKQFTKRETEAEKKNRLMDFLNSKDSSSKSTQAQKVQP